MFLSDPAVLEHFPEAILQLKSGLLVYANDMALHYFPHLEMGQPLPAGFDLPLSGSSTAGRFSAGLSTYDFSTTYTPDGTVCTVLLHPAPQTALTDRQLEGITEQFRDLLGEMAMSFGSQTVPDAGEPAPTKQADFIKTYHRMFRLLENLEFLRLAGSGAGTNFHPVTMDLAGLCSRLTAEAGTLLRERNISLEFQAEPASLLIPGDPQLLHRLLLELIANCTKIIGSGVIQLRLRRHRDRAVLVLSDSGSALSSRQLNALLQQDSDQLLPPPHAGAGLGMSVVRHIAALHGGSLLVQWGEASPVLILSLPTGPLDPHAALRTPNVQTDGGLNPLLVGLADVLPADLFGLEGLD